MKTSKCLSLRENADFAQNAKSAPLANLRMMDRGAVYAMVCATLAALTLVLPPSASASAQHQRVNCSRDLLPPDERPQFFPVDVFGPAGQLTASSYACYLRAMHERPLTVPAGQATTQVYRLTVIPAWRPPFIVRLEIGRDGAGRLVKKEARSQDDAATLVLDATGTVPKPMVKQFLALATGAGFWTMPTVKNTGKNSRVIVQTMDGVEWTLEGANAGGYHVVTRTSPHADPYWALVSYLFRGIGNLRMPPGPSVPR